MSTFEACTIGAAVLFSPVIAVLVTLWWEARKEKRVLKRWIFNTLMGGRHAPFGDPMVRALNLIDVAFHDVPEVRRLWREYFEMLNNDGLNNPNGFATRQKKNLELIAAIGAAIGYGRDITHLDVDRVYYPVALADQARLQRELAEQVPHFLKSVSDSLAAKQAAPAAVAPAQQALPAQTTGAGTAAS